MSSHREHIYSISTDDDDDDEEEDDEIIEEDHNKIHEPCSVVEHVHVRNDHKVGLINIIISLFFSRNKLINPKAQWVQEWNRVFLLVCAIGLFVDPLFFYAISISESCMCLFIDGWFVVAVTVLRCMGDGLHVWNMWLQFKMMINRRRNCSYLKSNKGFLFDVFVILPFPQVSLSTSLFNYFLVIRVGFRI